MTETIKISNREYEIKELKYRDLTGLADFTKQEAAKQLVILSTGMNEADYEELSLKDGIKLQSLINDINDLNEGFQVPLK